LAVDPLNHYQDKSRVAHATHDTRATDNVIDFALPARATATSAKQRPPHPRSLQ